MAMNLPARTSITSASTARRLFWLLVCLGAGLAVGVIGSSVTGDARWYLAVPAAIAVGWLVFADPTRCDPSAGCGRRE